MENIETSGIFEKLRTEALSLGAFRAEVIPTSEAVTDRAFREMCEANRCGVYGKCWTCPPDVGDIDELMADLKAHGYLLLFQTVTELEDSFDFENMQLGKKKHNSLIFELREKVHKMDGLKNVIVLGGGGCGYCEVCAKREDKPCRYPDKALASLEAYGIFVSKTAEKAGMKYINGQNTVTYFGAVVFDV